MANTVNEKDPGGQLETAHHIENIQHLQHGETAPYHFSLSKILAISGIVVGYMADAFNTQLAASTYSGINAKIGPDPFDIWIGGMLPLIGSAFGPFVGYLSDIYGRRNFLLVGALFGALGNLGSACSDSVPKVYGTGIIVGFGILNKQVSVAAVAEVFPRSWRPFVFGCFWAALAPAEGFGPIIGASILTYRSWKVTYWIPFALNVLALCLVFLFYHPLNQRIKVVDQTRWQLLASLDYVAGGLIGFGTALALIGVELGEFNLGWRDSRVLGCVVAGLFLLLGCVVPWGFLMRKRLPYPMLPRAVWGHYRRYSLNMVPLGFLALIASTAVFLWPLMVQVLFEQDPIKVGWLSSAPLITGVFLAPVFGWIFQQFGYQSNWSITCLAASLTLLTGVQVVLTPTSKVSATVLACLANTAWTGLVVGFGAIFQLVPHRYLGTSTAIYLWLRTCVNAAGALIFPTILKNSLPNNIVRDVAIPLAKAGVSPLLIPQVIEALTSGNTKSPVLGEVPLPALLAAGEGIKWAYVHTFRLIFYSTIAWGVCGTVAAALTKSYGSELTTMVDTTLLEGLHLNAKHDTDERPTIRQEEYVTHFDALD